jgi:hypothetical protein
VALDKGDIPGAIDCCLSPKLVSQFGVEKIRAGLQDAALKHKRKGGIKTFKVGREDVVGDVGGEGPGHDRLRRKQLGHVQAAPGGPRLEDPAPK